MELRREALTTYLRVRFNIEPNGGCTVTLLNSTGNATLDAEALSTLRQWRWKPAVVDGLPVASVQRLKVEFIVE